MCNGGGGDVAAVAVVATPAEEWSPIREPPLAPHHGTSDRFPAEEPGSSSDMDTEEDAGPRMTGPREGVALFGISGAVAAHSNVDFGAVADSDATLDISGGSSFVTASAGNLLNDLDVR